MRKHLLALLLSLAGLAFPQSAHAQFLGFVSPQTVEQTLAPAGTACTGALQTFNAPNLGQTQHQAILVFSGANAVPLTASIIGVDVAGHSTTISDILTGTVSSSANLLVGSGYFPIVEVAVTCSSPGTFQITYQGASATAYPPTNGSALLSQQNKVIFSNASAGSSAAQSILVTPFGNSSGYIAFSYGTVGPAGSTISVRCGTLLEPVGGTPTSSFTFTPSTGTSVQTIAVPSTYCPQIQINYNSGGASAAVYNLEYVFVAPGLTPPAVWQPAGQSNSESTSAANAAVSKTLSAQAGARVHVFSVSARCSAGTAQLTIADGGTQIWSTAATEVTTTTFRFQWEPGLAGSYGNALTVTLSTCGVSNTGTLDVQESQF